MIFILSIITRQVLTLKTACLLFLMIISSMHAADQWVYFGGYTGGISQGIYVSRMGAGGKLAPPQLAAAITNPSFLAIDSRHRFLYAVSEIAASGKKAGNVLAYAIDNKTGQLTKLNEQLAGGETLCHIQTDATDKMVMVASYGGGSIAALPIKADGSLGAVSSFIQHHGSSVNPRNQTSPHAHQVVTSPDNQFAFVCDLGLDAVLTYRLDHKNFTFGSNAIATTKLTPGMGPRHLAFHPNGKFAFVINEMGCRITAFTYDAKTGTLAEIQSLTTLPAGRIADDSFSGAEIMVHPSGKFLYGSTRGLNLMNVYSVAATSGQLTHLEDISSGGKTPRYFNLDPAGQFLLAANQNSDNVTVFKIDQASGRLTPTGESLHLGNPSCVVFAPVK